MKLNAHQTHAYRLSSVEGMLLLRLFISDIKRAEGGPEAEKKKINELKPGEEGDERKGLRRVSVRAVIKIQLDCFPLIISFVFFVFFLSLYIPF